MLTVTFCHDVDRIPYLQETLHDVILAFSRDPWVLRHSEATLHDLVPIGEGAVGADDWTFLSGAGAGGYCPPCGVQVGFCASWCVFRFRPLWTCFPDRLLYIPQHFTHFQSQKG